MQDLKKIYTYISTNKSYPHDFHNPDAHATTFGEKVGNTKKKKLPTVALLHPLM